MMTAPVMADEWSMSLGDMELEGISVAERTTGNEYHLSLTNLAMTATFTLDVVDGVVPDSGIVKRVSITGFDPDVLCREPGPQGLALENNTISGVVDCQLPPGIIPLRAIFR